MRSEVIIPFRVIFSDSQMIVGLRYYAVPLSELESVIERADFLYTQFAREPRNTKRFLHAVKERSKKSFQELNPRAFIHR